MKGVSVVDLAHKVSIVETIEQYVPLQYRNGKYYGLCPFHDDKSVGSFVVFPDSSSEKRGWFQCYACGEKGDNIDFVKKHLGLRTKEAAVTIALNAKIITPDEADVLLGKAVGDIQIKVPEKKDVSSEKKILLAKKKDPDHLSRVYGCFAAAAKPLPKDIQMLLLQKRRIPPSSLPKYFLVPPRSDLKWFWDRFRIELSKEFRMSGQEQMKELLIGVPGFYINNKGNISFPIDEDPRIGIKVFDREGRISGIQTRDMETADGVIESKEEKENRYKFLSSGYANGTAKAPGTMGCSCGYVEDILYPLSKRRESVIAVTEGRFKAEILSTLGYATVNMHSISNWKPAGDAALELVGELGASRFILCYDCEQNENVISSASGLYEKLSPVLPTSFAVWDPSFGKGIDDVVIAGHLKDISRISANEYLKTKAG